MNIEALKYYHRLRRQGFVLATARNATLLMFSANFEDWARRTQRYISIPIYPEFMNFGIDDAGIISHGSDAQVLQALNQIAHPRFKLSKEELNELNT